MEIRRGRTGATGSTGERGATGATGEAGPRGPMDTSSHDPLLAIAQEMPKLRSEVRLNRRSNKFIAAIGTVAFITVAFVLWQQHQDDLRDEAADRQYELDQCERGNVTRKAIAEGRVADSEALIAAAGNPTTERGQQVIDAYRKRVAENVKAFAPRDCLALLEKADK